MASSILSTGDARPAASTSPQTLNVTHYPHRNRSAAVSAV